MKEIKYRLGQLSREFNINATTIINFLKKHKIEIENNPNAKLDQQAYDLLIAEYSKDSREKTTSESKLKINNKPKSIKTETPVRETITVNSQEIKDEIGTLKGPKILGTMDLENNIRKGKEANSKKPASQNLQQKAKNKAEPLITEITGVSKVEEESIAPETKIIDIDVTINEEKQKIVEERVEPEGNANKELEFQSVIHDTGSNLAEVSLEQQKIVEQYVEPEGNIQGALEPPETENTKNMNDIQKNQDVVSNMIELKNNTKEIVQIASDKENSTIKVNVTNLSGLTIVGKMELPIRKNNNKKDPYKKKKIVQASKVDIANFNKTDRNQIATTSTPVANTWQNTKPKTNNTGNSGQNYTKNPVKETKPAETKTNVSSAPQTISQTNVYQKNTNYQPKPQHRGSFSSNASANIKASRGYKKAKKEAYSQRQDAALEKEALTDKILQVSEFVTVADLAAMMNVKPTQIIASLMSVGVFASINQRLSADIISLVAEEYGFTVDFVSAELNQVLDNELSKPENLRARAPIVTVMGHVDHGKTSLLDYIRKSNVIAAESGGITQHMGAYSVETQQGKKITFLDTPGHEAFTAMRARGTELTDLAVIVVAADDSVMPQTKEAIHHAQAAGVPMVFAINKIDKYGVNPTKIREDLAHMNILVEDWGGKYQVQEISAKTGLNIDLLLEKILLEAELLELQADPFRKAIGTVVESALDKGKGYISTLLIQNGTLNVGDIVLSGTYYGKIRAMYNERGMKVSQATPSTPVSVLGLNGAPNAGEKFNVITEEREAREIATRRTQLSREQGLKTKKHVTLDELGRRIAVGDFKELNIIIKGDVDGSLEALADSLEKLSVPEVQVRIIHKAVGQITETDVALAAASEAIIIGFQVRPSVGARKMAEIEAIDIRLYSIIYQAIDEIRAAMEGMLSLEIKEEIIGNVEIREVFKISKIGTVAGCYVNDGKITRDAKVRLLREGIVIYTGEIGQLKRFKDDVKEVAYGYECGLSIQNYNDLKVGDVVEAYKEVSQKRKL